MALKSTHSAFQSSKRTWRPLKSTTPNTHWECTHTVLASTTSRIWPLRNSESSTSAHVSTSDRTQRRVSQPFKACQAGFKCQKMSTGESTMPSHPSRTRSSAEAAGLFQQLVLWKVLMPVPPVNSSPYPSSNWLTTHPNTATMDAMVVWWIMLLNMLSRTVVLILKTHTRTMLMYLIWRCASKQVKCPQPKFRFFFYIGL